MYSLILNSGNIVIINATSMEWFSSNKLARFYFGKELVAQVNMDNIVGYIKTDYKIKSEEDGDTVD